MQPDADIGRVREGKVEQQGDIKLATSPRRSAVNLAALLLTAAVFAGGAASAGTLGRIGQDKTIRIAYREDAPPFSYKDKTGAPAGFIVDLCREVVKKLADQLHLASLDIAYVPVTSADRFTAIQQQKVDLLCGPSTATLSRREVVGFSIPTFVDGASLMIRVDGPHDLKAMAGQKIGVLTNTTTEGELHESLQKAGINAEVTPVKAHSEGLALLDDGKISAYFADRSILVSLIKESRASGKLMIAENYLALEAYALALPRGDEDFRLAVDRALSHIYRSGAITSIFKRTFGESAKPDQILQAVYLVSGLPD
jgi:polar amino acid transport system substrate-binding protein/glutamate/aspartate transport system substrate-binding protein